MNQEATLQGSRPMLRWSSARDCARKAVYEATGAPARERYDSEERILFRGKRLGRDYGDLLALKYGEDALERERKIVWPLGVGHADIYLRETKTIIEVLSSAHASDAMRLSKLLQLVGYLEHDPEADNGVLVVLNPSDYSEDRTVVSQRSDAYKALVEEMRDRIAALQEWDATGDLPARVCAKPADARSHFCLHADHCFEGWERPQLEQVTASAELVEAVAEFAEASAGQQAADREARGFAARKREAQAVIEAAELPAGMALQVGPFKLTRTSVQRKPTFEWEKAELAGVFEPGLYGDYFKPGASYSTFKTERVDHSGDEFGEDSPF